MAFTTANFKKPFLELIYFHIFVSYTILELWKQIVDNNEMDYLTKIPSKFTPKKSYEIDLVNVWEGFKLFPIIYYDVGDKHASLPHFIGETELRAHSVQLTSLY